MTAIPDWNGRRATAALEQVRADGARHHTPCWICQKPIDYTLRYPHRRSCTVQHIIARTIRPDLTWHRSNWAPAHLQCNQDYGDGTQLNPYDLGITS